MPRSHGDRRQIGCVVSREPRPSQTVKPELPCTVLTACCTVARAPHPEGWPIGVGRRSPINYRRDPAGGWGGDAEPVFRQTPNLSGVVGEVNGLRGEISSLLASGWKLRLETAIGNCDIGQLRHRKNDVVVVRYRGPVVSVVSAPHFPVATCGHAALSWTDHSSLADCGIRRIRRRTRL